jgi:Tol biopolymer transport system component
LDSRGDIQEFVVNTDGTSLVQVTLGKGERNIHSQWSSDGSAVYFYQIRPTISFRKISIGDASSTELVSGWEWGTQFGARVDPQGKRIIYSRLDKGSVAATMVHDLESGRETAFTMPLNFPSWSHDGRFVLGVDQSTARGDMRDIVVCPSDGGACRKVAKGSIPRWSADNARIYFKRDGNLKDGVQIWSISLDGDDERHVLDLRPLHPIGQGFDVSAEGR